MKRKLARSCPPYEGGEEYLFLCFSDADAAAVAPLMARLYERGCRVWYSTGKSADVAELSHRQTRMSDASLTVLYLTDAARADVDVKSAVLYCQAQGKPIICIDTDEGDSGLSMGLTEQVRHVSAGRFSDLAALEAELIRTEGFSQDLIGERPIRSGGGQKRAAIILAALALLLLVGGFAGGRFFGWFSPETPAAEDTIHFSDPALTDAARAAVGGGALTEESLSAVIALRLEALPEDTDELALFPALTRLEIPQSDGARAAALLDDYAVVLYGEGAP